MMTSQRKVKFLDMRLLTEESVIFSNESWSPIYQRGNILQL